MATQQERAELHKTIWKIANDLRGSVDGWDFKAYVLGSIFYRFISENICDYIHQLMTAAGQPDFDYKAINDTMAENIRQKMVEEKGYFILPSQLFQNVVKNCDKDENLNETLSFIENLVFSFRPLSRNLEIADQVRDEGIRFLPFGGGWEGAFVILLTEHCHSVDRALSTLDSCNCYALKEQKADNY